MNLSKKSSILVSTLALTTICAVSFAQNPPAAGARQGRGQGGQRGGGQVTLANVPVAALDKALTLSADQKTKIEAIQKKAQDDLRALAPQPGAQPDPAARQKRGEINAAATKDIEALLKDDQKTKVADLLKSLPGYGPAKVSQLLEQTGIDASRRAAGLGERQRQALIDALK